MPTEEAFSSSSDITSSDTVDDQHTASNSNTDSDNENTGTYQSNMTLRPPKSGLIFKVLWFVFVWQAAFHISGAAIKCILQFLKYFIKALGSTYLNPALDQLSTEIPISIKTAEKYLGIDYEHSGIVEYVVCPKCDSIYSYNNCVHTRANGQKLGKHCCYVKYPRHPHHSHRKACDTELLEAPSLTPFKTYCYHPLYLSLQHLALRPGFLNKCEQWSILLSRECV